MPSQLSDPQEWAKNYKVPSDLGIEEPLAPARPVGTEKDSGIPVGVHTSSIPTSQAQTQSVSRVPHGTGRVKEEWESTLSEPVSKPPIREVGQSQYHLLQRFSIPYADALLARQHELDRYASIDGMDHEKKLAALKDMKINPFMLSNPYDGLTNSLQRWKTIATSSKAQALNPDQRIAAAGNYYDKMIAPFYHKMGAEPISKELWMKQAYGAALQWNIDDAYQSHWRQGIFAGFRDIENIGRTGLAMLGGVVKDGMNLAEAMGFTALSSSKYAQEHDVVATSQKIREDIKQKGGIYKHLVANTESIPILGSTYKSLSRVASEDGFWHDINPSEKWYQGLGSWVEEQAMMMPFYSVLGGYNAKGIQMLSEAGATAKFMANPAGKTVAHLLMNGGEGAAWGLSMRDDGDKHNAWQDAIGQAILGTVFHGAGAAIGKSKTAIADAMAKKLELGSKGLKEGTTETMEEQMVDSAAHTMAAGGRPLQNSVVRTALDRIREFEVAKASLADIEKARAQDLSTPVGKAMHTKVWDHISYIQKFLGEKGKTFADLEKDEQAELLKKLQNISDKAAKKAPAVVKPIQEATGKKAVAEAKKTTGGKSTLQKLAEDERKKDLAQGIPEKKPEVYQVLAEQRLAEANAKAAAKAAKEGSKEPISEAIDIDKKRVKAQAKAPKARLRTVYKEDKYGQPSVSFGVDNTWISYMKVQLKADKLDWTKPGDIAKWLEGLSHEDFVQDLHDHFYPKELKDAGLFFEHQNVQSMGKENPNFLAFMYNYTDKMPREFARELSSRLEDTMKFESTFSARRPTEVQKEFYAKGMWNHVADFLHSPSFESGERNIYRTTYENLKTPTKWQMQLHEEVVENERNMIRDMFGHNKDAMDAALAAHEALSSGRQRAFLAGRQAKRAQYASDIDVLLSQSGERERMSF